MVYESLCKKGKEKRWLANKDDVVLGCFLIMPIFYGESMPYEMEMKIKGNKKRSTKRGKCNVGNGENNLEKQEEK
jgi:hypothetical protein